MNAPLSLRSFSVAIALLSVSVFVAFALPARASPQGTRLEGVVHDASGASVAGAQVELHTSSYSAKAITSATGAFAFENVPGTSGMIVVAAPGLKEVRQSWNAVSGAAVQLEVVLQLAPVNQQVLVTAART